MNGKKFFKKILPACIMAALASVTALFSSCGNTENSGGTYPDGTITESPSENDSPSDNPSSGNTSGNASSGSSSTGTEIDTDIFSKRDLDPSYDDGSDRIALSDGASVATNESVNIDGDVIEITDGGTYIVSGSLSDGRIVINADGEKVQLVLSGASVTSSDFAALYVKSADKVFITLDDGTENSFSSLGFVQIDENSVDGAVFSKDDLTINGCGSLTVSSADGHGIVGKDDLKITGGTLDITADKSGINGKDCVGISGGDITIDSGTDGIHSENSDDGELGYVYISGGTLGITAESDGIEAASVLQLVGGTAKINAGGKGFKAGGSLLLYGGEASVTSSDDSFHSDLSITVSGGTYTVSTGDDGLHSNGDLTVSDGEIKITKSYEGLEGQNILISGGNISVTASDDGLNASGGNDESGFGGFGGDMFNSSSDCSIVISGGYIYVNASGDGIDSNGTLTVSGGETYVDGPTNGGNGALDYGSSATITGGIFIAVGTSDMAVNFTSAEQGAIMYNVSSYASGEIVLSGDDGEILSYTPAKKYNSVIVSCPSLVKGGSYTLSIGGNDYSVTLSSLIYGSSGGFGGGGQGGPGGGHGGFGGRR